MLEKDIEAKVRAKAIAAGWLVYKFTSPSRRSVPDRLFIRGGRVAFVEFKRPGGTLTAGQAREIDRLRHAGAEVYVCYSVEEACDALGI
jgi:hypothetical protein